MIISNEGSVAYEYARFKRLYILYLLILRVVILGVKEGKTKTIPEERFIIQSIENSSKQKEDFWNTINGNKVNVNLLIDEDVEIVNEDSISILVIHVPRADFNMRPVYVVENPYKGTYKRNLMKIQ